MNRSTPCCALTAAATAAAILWSSPPWMAWAGEPGPWRTVLAVGRIDASARDLNVLSVFPEEFIRAVAALPDPLTADTWPQIQTGTNDMWAGGKSHGYRLAVPTPHRTGTYRLRVGLLAGHPTAPPNLIIRLDGRQVAAHQVRAGRQLLAVNDTIQDIDPDVMELLIPAEALGAEQTLLEIALDAPSAWVFYDGLEVAWSGRGFRPAVGDVSFESDLLVFRSDAGSVQRPRLRVELAGVEAPVDAEVTAGDGAVLTRRRFGEPGDQVLFGIYEIVPDVAASTESRSLRLRLRGPGIDMSRSFELPGYRPLELYVVPQAHFDNGYTHPQEETVALHLESLDRAIEFGQRYENFSWTNESAYILQRWWEAAGPRDRQRLTELIRDGTIGLDAGWLNMLTGLCTTEELHRWLLWAGTFAREHDLDLSTVSITDAPSHVWSVPQILAGSGIEFLSIGANPDRSAFWRFAEARSHNPFWWEGPDGSRVLTLVHRHYAHATMTGLTASLELAERSVPPWLDRFYGPDAKGGGYQYDVLHLHGAYWDNRVLDERLPAVVDAWNSKYAWPKIRLATNREFFERLRQEAASRAEMVRGDQGAYWEDGAASSAVETALNREAARTLALAETLLAGLHASGRLAEVPVEQIRRAWEAVLLYDEHTWGAAWSVTAPDDPRTFGQFSTKAGYAREASRLADLLLALVAAEIPEARRPRRPLGGGHERVQVNGPVISSPHVRVAVSETTGLISSITALPNRHELVEGPAPGRVEDGFGQVLYYTKDRHDPPNNLDDRQVGMALSKPRFVELRSEPDRLVSVFAHDGLGRLEMHVAPIPDGPRIDVEYRFLAKPQTTRLESVYAAFPFALQQPVIDYEVGGAMVRAGRDWIERTCLDWFSVQDFVVLRDEPAGRAIVWSPLDAPLVCLQDVTTHRGLEALPITNGRVYSYLMNNFWQTNYQAAQGGEMTFRYA
ncbi:MAG: glycoside hydrolase family 38 N-terminal domain-containing protein, partial [Planctomycetota bacterium]